MLTQTVYTLPFDTPIANNLRAEFAAMPWRRRMQTRRKALMRELALRFGEQGRLRLDRMPADCKRVLWIYSWTTVGDAIMDLAARCLVPAGVHIDLCIAPHLAPLFMADAVFSKVYTDIEQCERNPDFILLDCYTSALLRQKDRHFPNVPFASLRGHLVGEQFDRVAYGDRRMRQLLGLPPGPVIKPRVCVAHAENRHRSAGFRLAVALGARRPERRYPWWPQVLERLAARWPSTWPTLGPWLLGSEDAKGELASFENVFPPERCVSKLGCGSLQDTAGWLADCDAFVGVDGGLMHLAMALDVPGLALFTHSDPAYFAPRSASMEVLHRPARQGPIAPQEVADRLLAVCSRLPCCPAG